MNYLMATLCDWQCVLACRWADFKMNLAFWTFKHLVPRGLVYWALVYAGSEASTHSLSYKGCTEITFFEVLDAWQAGPV